MLDNKLEELLLHVRQRAEIIFDDTFHVTEREEKLYLHGDKIENYVKEINILEKKEDFFKDAENLINYLKPLSWLRSRKKD